MELFMLSVFPYLELTASMSFLLALPSSPIQSMHCFKPSYADISSYTLSHFCLSITPQWKKNIHKHFDRTYTYFRGAVISCPFLLKLYTGSPKSFQTFSKVFALASHTILHDPDEKQLLKFWDSTLASFCFVFLMLFNIQFFSITCFFNVSLPHIFSV